MTTAPTVRPAVLLLEDEAIVREPLRRYLEQVGFDVIGAGSVEIAVALLDEVDIAAAILDVRMPRGRSGLEVLQHMRVNARWQQAPAIVLTGALLSEAEEEIIRRDRAYVFYKPHGYKEIAAQLKKLLAHT
jgi:DNA-binding response OmpR family regulator